jgi:TatA/E family protein of Tat protein translocase
MPPGLGPVHLLVIAVVALLVLGPEKLPQVARQAGKAMGEFRRWREFAEDEVRSVLKFDAEPEPDASALSPADEHPNEAANPPWEADRYRAATGSAMTPSWVVTDWHHVDSKEHAEPSSRSSATGDEGRT